MKSNKSHKNTKAKRGRSNVPEFAGQTKQQTKQTKANRFDSNSDHKLVLGYKVTAVKSELESLEFTLEGYTGISTAIWRERKVDWRLEFVRRFRSTAERELFKKQGIQAGRGRGGWPARGRWRRYRPRSPRSSRRSLWTGGSSRSRRRRAFPPCRSSPPRPLPSPSPDYCLHHKNPSVITLLHLIDPPTFH